jgi:hypothetical protein
LDDVPSVVEFEWRFDSHLGGLLAIINSALAATSRVTTGASLTWAKSRTRRSSRLAIRGRIDLEQLERGQR